MNATAGIQIPSIPSPRCRLYPPAWKPYGLEAEPEAKRLYYDYGAGVGTLIGNRML